MWLLVGGPLPPSADGLTIGRLIIVRRGHENSEYLLRHEQVHVRQWRRHGPLGFPVRYLAGYVRGRLQRYGHKGAYLRIPFEIEADWVARRTLLAHSETTEAEPAATR